MNWKLITEEEAKTISLAYPKNSRVALGLYSSMVSGIYWKTEDEEFFVRAWENGMGRMRSMAYDRIGPLGLFGYPSEATMWIEENFVGTQKQLDISKK